MESFFAGYLHTEYRTTNSTLAGYPPRQMKNLLIIGKAQRKGIQTKILSKALLDITLKNKFTLWSSV